MESRFQPAKPAAAFRIEELTQRFDYYVEVFDENPPFSAAQLESHKETLALRSRFTTAQEAARDRQFGLALRNTLIKWGMGGRGSNLVEPEDFVAAIQNIAGSLPALEARRIDQPSPNEAETSAEIWAVIEDLNIVCNKNRIVASTKALHHLLPNLVPPMDREYTQTFFGWANPEFQYHAEECFRFAFEALARIARAVTPTQYLGAGWRTSVTKVLDNALVGSCRSHGLQSSNRAQRERDKALLKKAKELGLL